MKKSPVATVFAILAALTAQATPIGQLEVYEVVISKPAGPNEFPHQAAPTEEYLSYIRKKHPAAVIKKSKTIAVELNRITEGRTGYTLISEDGSQNKAIGSTLKCCGIEQENGYTKILVNYQASSLFRPQVSPTNDAVIVDERDLNTQLLVRPNTFTPLGALQSSAESRHFIAHFIAHGTGS